MNSAKIRLSAAEQELIADPGWILTKNRILAAIQQLLEALHPAQQDWLRSIPAPLPDHLLKIPAKISKGENYLGLPYRILDYPRCFDGADVFTVRTMFWWGHFFSVTLQLSGRYKTACEPALLAARNQLTELGAFLCTDPDPWQHHFNKGYYTAIADMPAEEYKTRILHGPFIKLACKHGLSGWEALPSRLLEDFKGLVLAAGYGH